MTNAASRICDELAAFADLGTEAPQATYHDDRLVVRMIRGGEDLQLELLNHGNGAVVEHPLHGRPRRVHASYRALLASETFSDLRVWADHQKTLLQETFKDVGIPIHVTGLLSDNSTTLDIAQLNDFLVSHERNPESVQIMLIDGPAGIGKTKFIEFLAHSRARDFVTGRRPLVLHVQGRGRVLTFLQDLIAFSLQRLRLAVTFDQVPILVRHGLLTVAIDGFDELGDPNGYDLAWGQVNELVNQIRGRGTLILAGRETFIGRERISKKIASLRQHDVVNVLSLQPPAPEDARTWLKTRNWSDNDVASAAALFEPDSYALRPVFLIQLAGTDGLLFFQEHAVGHPLTFLVDLMIEREATKFGNAIDQVMSVEQRRSFVRHFLREVARYIADDQTEAIDEVSLMWLVELVVPPGVDNETLVLLKNRAAVMAFLENDDMPRYRRFAHSQPFHYFLSEAAMVAVSNKEVPKFIRRNILGADYLSAFSDLVLRMATADGARLQRSFSVTSELTRNYLSSDRGARNLGTLLLTMLPAMYDSDDALRVEDVAVDESLIQETAPEAVLSRVAVNQLDLRGADLRPLTFVECWIGTLIVDDTTRVPPSCPIPDRIRLERPGNRQGSVIERPEKIKLWLDRHGRGEGTAQEESARLIPRELLSERLVVLLERACRSRVYWIPKDRSDDDQASKFTTDDQWPKLLELLRRHNLLREDKLRSSGRKSAFFHIKRRADILRADSEDRQIRDFYAALVETLRE